MIKPVRRPLVFCLILALSLLPAQTARAGIAGASNAKTTGVIFALVGVGALIGVGVYLAATYGHALKGCASTEGGAFQIRNEGDQHVYALTGDVAGVQAGQRVRVAGHKDKAKHTFAVSRLTHTYGPCAVQPQVH